MPGQQPKAGQLAEGVAVMNQELKSPDEKAKTDTSEAATDGTASQQQSERGSKHLSRPSYGSAAAFLGFRY